MDYLIWYREVLSLKIENRTSVEQIEVADHGFNIRIKYGVIEEEIPVRKIILATGREGMAEPGSLPFAGRFWSAMPTQFRRYKF